MSVRFLNKEATLPLYVAHDQTPTLLGRDWINALGMSLADVKELTPASAVNSILEKYKEVFSDVLGTLQGVKAKITIQEGAHPKFFKPRAIPFALQDKVAQELQRLQREGIICPVRTSEWAAPIVPVLKSDGRVRICGDFKVTVNPATILEKYPVPRLEDMWAKLSGGVKFTKLDLKDAYQQVELEPESKKLVTINTPKGLFQYTRLPFGVASAPAIFQREMENLLQDMRHVVVYFDDILVTGLDDKDHLKNLEQVLQRLEEAGLKLKLEKCTFMACEVEYLGHVIGAKGLKPTPQKVEAVVNAPRPVDLKQLQSYLGLINYYRRFLPNLSSILRPLYNLCRTGMNNQLSQASILSIFVANLGGCLLKRSTLAPLEQWILARACACIKIPTKKLFKSAPKQPPKFAITHTGSTETGRALRRGALGRGYVSQRWIEATQKMSIDKSYG